MGDNYQRFEGFSQRPSASSSSEAKVSPFRSYNVVIVLEIPALALARNVLLSFDVDLLSLLKSSWKLVGLALTDCKTTSRMSFY